MFCNKTKQINYGCHISWHNVSLFFTFLLCFLLISHAKADAVSEALVTDDQLGIGIFIENINDINEKDESIDISITLNGQWIDKELGEKIASEGLDVKAFTINSYRAYSTNVPAMDFLGQRDAPHIGSNRVFAYANGLVDFTANMLLTLDVSMDIKRFPFDKQVFDIEFRMIRKLSRDFDIIIDENATGISEDASMEGWRILGYSASTIDYVNKAGVILPEFKLSVEVERKADFYIFKVLIPLLVIMVLANCVLWLRNQPSVNLFSVIMVILLTIVAFQWSVTESIPKVSYITYMVSILLFSYIYVASIIPIIVIHNNLSEQKANALLKACRWIYPLLYPIGLMILSFYYLL